MKFSVIVPVYNSSATIEQCVNSILDGTYSDFELILVDDGSTDNSLEICETLASKESRITVIHQENKGAASARNNGIRNSRGEYLCFIDSDDTVTEDYLHTINEYRKKFSPDIIWFNMRCIDEDGVELFSSHHVSSSTRISQKEYLECFFGMNVNIGSMCSKVYRRKFIMANIDDLLDEERIYGEDWDFNLRCGFHNPEIVLAKETLYNYIKYSTHNTVSTRYYIQDLNTYCQSYLQLLDIATKYKIEVPVKEQNSLFVYNVISLLNKLYQSSLTKDEKNDEFNRIVKHDTFKKVVSEGMWDNRYMSKKQYCIGVFLKYRLINFAKLLLKI